MEVPAGTEGFQVVFVRANVNEAAIGFDLHRRRITLAGRDEGVLRGLLATLQATGGAEVKQNQVLLLNRWPAAQFSYIFRDGVLLAESAPTLSLRVTAEDAARNVGVATAGPKFR
jgi:hypothetical protein